VLPACRKDNLFDSVFFFRTLGGSLRENTYFWDMEKEQRTALVTGAARGIGQGIARSLAAEGFSLFLADKLAEARDTVAQCRDLGARVEFISCDITAPDQRAALLQAIKDHSGRLDVLINNAGINVKERKDLLEVAEEDYDPVMDTNLKSPFFLTQKIAAWMMEQKEAFPDRHPLIVNIASLTSYAASIHMAPYCFSKTGVSMMTQLFAQRLAPHGIGVYEIRPGIIQTEMTVGARDKYDRFIAAGGLPIARWGLPEDVGTAVLAIVNGYLPYSTGEVINVDGGFHMRKL